MAVARAALPATLFLASAAPPARGQVAVAPTVIVLAEPERFGALTVENRSAAAQEVTVEFRFGYPASDSLGNLRMVYDDSATAARFSMASWVRAFPRRVLLGPGQRQLVRLTVRPPANLPDGVYWTRLITSSVPQSARVDSVARGITAQITFRLQQITTVLYRRGRAETGIEIGALAVRQDSVELQLLVPLKRTGIAPFLGTVALRVLDPAGRLVQEGTEITSVYFSLTKRFAVPRARLTPGTYAAEVKATAERSDVVPEALFPMVPVVIRTQFTVP
ncbi:MAG: hypothetical protein ABR499_23530 [Gemmatimonadaceae bacterium]